MKRIAIAFCLLLLLAQPVQAQEYDYCAGAGGAACANVETDSDTTRSTGIVGGSDATPDRYCLKGSFTAAGTGTYTVKNIQLQIRKVNSGAHVVTVSLCDLDGTSNCVVWDDTVNIATTGTETTTWVSVNDATGKALTNGIAYTIVLSADSIDATNTFVWGVHTSAGTNHVASNDASGCSGSWTNQSANTTPNFKLNTCAQ